MEDRYTLKLDFLHYWRCGTGKGSGSHVDATVDTDEYGCPFVGGSMLKGLLRDAVQRSVSWTMADRKDANGQTDATAITECLFGSSGFFERRATTDTKPGIIRLGNATLPQDTRRWLSENHTHRNALFQDLYATAINSTNGTAKKGSLRGQQVVVPLELSAELSVARLSDNSESDKKTGNWVYANHQNLIKAALPLIRAVGSGRTRGFGRVSLSLEAH